jgi:hypothetical protein
MRVICDGVPQVAKSKRVHRGQTYFQLDDGRLIPADKCQSIPDFAPGDIIRLVNPNCWEAKLWKIGDRATVKLVWENGTRLVIETAKSKKDDFCYTVDAANWEVVP